MLPKPLKGAFTRERRRKARLHKAAETAVMREARARDGHRCRMCQSRQDTEVAHLRHRGLGGNPSGDRTTLAGLVTLCRVHHQRFDGTHGPVSLRISPGPDGANGDLQFEETL